MFRFTRPLLFVLPVLLLLGSMPNAIAQEYDPTVKDLPDFIMDRPEALPQSVVTPKDDTLSDDAAISAPDEPRAARDDMDEIPDEYIIEASQFGEACRNDPGYTLYFDCRCLAVSYLDARIEMGPETHSSGIINRLGGLCKDGTGIAGQIYNDCLNDFGNAPTNVGPEEFCSCMSNQFAKTYETFRGRATGYLKVRMRAQARLICMDPVAARRIYGVVVP